jgi:hypothetical protein
VELALAWDGGLNTALHESRIGPTEISACSNAIARDGRIRLDQRYILKAQVQSGSMTPQGSGWGKYGSGTLSHQYVAVNDNKLYEYDINSPGWVQANTGLSSGDYFWQQFTDYLYCVNATAGLGRKKLAAGSNGHGDFAAITPPVAPAAAPTAPQNNSAQTDQVFTGGTLATTGSPGTSAIQADGSILIVWPSGGAGVQTVSITFKTATPDNRPDLSYHDTLYTNISGTVGFGDVELDVYSTSNTGGTRAVPWVRNPLTSFPTIVWRIANIARTDRVQVTKLVFTVTVPSNGGTFRIRPTHAAGVWLSLDRSTNVGLNAEPALKPLQYEYTYYNSTTGLESPPSPQLVIPASSQYHFGEWREVAAATTAASGVDKIRIYRRVEEGGAITRYRLAEVNNSGTPAVTDKYTVDEVKAFTVYKPTTLPTSGWTGITSWLNRLVIFTALYVYISRDHATEASTTVPAFEPLTGQYDPFDAARGLTQPIDDRLAESIYGGVGQDSLYVVTNYSVRALVGSTADNWRLIKIGEEGACGVRAWAPYKGGVLVLTPSGRLLFHHASLSEPNDAGEKLRPRIGASGLKAVATSSAIVAVTPLGEIEITDSTGAYFIMDLEGRWRAGTWTHPWHSVLFVSGLPIRWMGTNGKLYEGGDDTYVSDGGTTATNGTAVTWSVATRKHLLPRQAVTNIFWGDSSGAPSAAITTPRGTTTYAKTSGKRNRHPAYTNNGESVLVTITGDKNTIVEECRLRLEDLSEAAHL